MNHAAQPSQPGVRSFVRLTLWIGLLAGSHLALTAAGSVLPTPPAPWDFGPFVEWMQGHDVAAVSFSVLRILALVITWYLAALTGLVVAAQLSGLRGLGNVAHRLAVPWARTLLRHVMGAGLVVSLAGGVAPMLSVSAAGAATPVTALADSTPSTVVVNEQGAGTMMMRKAAPKADAARRGNESAPVMRRVRPDGAAVTGDEEAPVMRQAPGTAEPAPRLGQALGRAARPMPNPAPGADDMMMRQVPRPDATWTIAPGQHVWHIAAATLDRAHGHPATDDDIARYVDAIIERNRDRFAVAGQYDLVYPGQIFELPPTPTN